MGYAQRNNNRKKEQKLKNLIAKKNNTTKKHIYDIQNHSYIKKIKKQNI